MVVVVRGNCPTSSKGGIVRAGECPGEYVRGGNVQGEMSGSPRSPNSQKRRLCLCNAITYCSRPFSGNTYVNEDLQCTSFEFLVD